ncbi:uncharacterized protein LOC125038248 isoform X2 [Penaeus chinensis]|uniref:uncharacterized protein LOC125038248 isoform X2 n=1 Tax=Penaeus chinensis TaxID=139456 RepID=UPI001FB6A486|nr:uncharacterized protein LOC125038248 isoform X2 [Penaeus chinensis]
MTCAYTVYIHLTLKSPSERNDGQESNTGHSLGGIRRGFTCRVKTCPTCHRDGRCSSTSPSFHISSRSIDMGLRIFELFQICMFT